MQYDLSEDQINSLKQMEALKKAAKAIAEAAKIMKMTNTSTHKFTPTGMFPLYKDYDSVCWVMYAMEIGTKKYFNLKLLNINPMAKPSLTRATTSECQIQEEPTLRLTSMSSTKKPWICTILSCRVYTASSRPTVKTSGHNGNVTCHPSSTNCLQGTLRLKKTQDRLKRERAWDMLGV